MGSLFVDLGNGVKEFIGILPDVANTAKEFGENLIFDTGADGERQVSAIFGFIVLGGIVGAVFGIFKAITRKVSK